MSAEEWEIRVTNELLAWINTLDERTRAQVVDAIDPWRSAILHGRR